MQIWIWESVSLNSMIQFLFNICFFLIDFNGLIDLLIEEFKIK